MSKIDDGGPAFPDFFDYSKHGAGGVIVAKAGGLSIRDWFAGQALVGIGMWCPSNVVGAERPRAVAEYAYAVADAMIAARKDGQGGGT